MTALTYAQRAQYALNPTGKRLLTLLDEKKTNLALSADVTSAEELLRLAEILGPEICLIKTHIDIVEDYTPKLTQRLSELAEKHKFLLFEDRKFADIGNTVRQQYQGGVYHIADWADIVNAHLVPGPGIVDGLKAVGRERGRGLILLAEMSSQGSMSYPQEAVAWAKANLDFIIGFICQRKLTDDPALIHLTPGVQLAEGKDALGQQYNTPAKIIGENRSDIQIVGRGITESADPLESARRYREAGWEAYRQRFY